ncbi:MAG TPA: hypothetical protein VII55_00320 [Candidatus Saccharimonadales bacterium]
MTHKRQTAQLTNQALQRVSGLVFVYLVLVFVLPASHATMRAYHLSTLEYRTLLFAVTLPSILTWLAAFFGYAKLSQYAYSIRKTSEGVYFDKLASGCAWLAWSLPLPAIIALILNGLANQWPGFYPASIIVSNYLNLLLPLIAFSIIGIASRGLVNQSKLKFSLGNVRAIMVLFLTFGVLYCYLAFQRFDLTSLSSTHNPYFLPIWLMVISVIIPYLYAWFVGLLAAYEITLFGQQTDGVLYRQALRLLVLGLIFIIGSSIALQYMSGVRPRVGHLVFDYQLVLTSLFRLIGGGGFIMLAIGSSRLKKIEEV